MPQLVHAINMPVARAGLIADLGATDKISRLGEDAAGAHAGMFVVPGTISGPGGQAIAPTSAAEITDGDGLGVVMYDASQEPGRTAAALAAGNEYDVQQTLPIVAKGRIWVRCDDAAVITVDIPAFVRYVAGAGERLGDFREDVDTADAAALPNAWFRSAHVNVNFNGVLQRIALLQILQPST